MSNIKEKIKVTAAEIEKANNINVLEYLLLIGEPLKNESNNFYRHMDHDSLVINSKKNYFSWNSRNVSGNAVTYLMNMYDFSFQHAVKKINTDMEGKNLSLFEAPKPSYPSEFNYDVTESSTNKNIIDYLVHDRKIDYDLVHSFIRLDLIKEDSCKNVVFKWKEKGKLIGADLQGTRIIPLEKRFHADRLYFKKVLPTTRDATYSGFNITRGYPDKIYFFESSIDLLSYFSLNRSKLKNCRLQSMNGLKGETVIRTLKNTLIELEENGRTLDSIVLCVDNDSAGKEFVDKLQELNLKRKSDGKSLIKSDIPKMPAGQKKWDWNNELKFIKSNSLKKKKDQGIEL